MGWKKKWKTIKKIFPGFKRSRTKSKSPQDVSPDVSNTECPPNDIDSTGLEGELTPFELSNELTNIKDDTCGSGNLDDYDKDVSVKLQDAPRVSTSNKAVKYVRQKLNARPKDSGNFSRGRSTVLNIELKTDAIERTEFKISKGNVRFSHGREIKIRAKKGSEIHLCSDDLSFDYNIKRCEEQCHRQDTNSSVDNSCIDKVNSETAKPVVTTESKCHALVHAIPDFKCRSICGISLNDITETSDTTHTHLYDEVDCAAEPRFDENDASIEIKDDYKVPDTHFHETVFEDSTEHTEAAGDDESIITEDDNSAVSKKVADASVDAEATIDSIEESRLGHQIIPDRDIPAPKHCDVFSAHPKGERLEGYLDTIGSLECLHIGEEPFATFATYSDDESYYSEYNNKKQSQSERSDASFTAAVDVNRPSKTNVFTDSNRNARDQLDDMNVSNNGSEIGADSVILNSRDLLPTVLVPGDAYRKHECDENDGSINTTDEPQLNLDMHADELIDYLESEDKKCEKEISSNHGDNVYSVSNLTIKSANENILKTQDAVPLTEKSTAYDDIRVDIDVNGHIKDLPDQTSNSEFEVYKIRCDKNKVSNITNDRLGLRSKVKATLDIYDSIGKYVDHTSLNAHSKMDQGNRCDEESVSLFMHQNNFFSPSAYENVASDPSEMTSKSSVNKHFTNTDRDAELGIHCNDSISQESEAGEKEIFNNSDDKDVSVHGQMELQIDSSVNKTYIYASVDDNRLTDEKQQDALEPSVGGFETEIKQDVKFDETSVDLAKTSCSMQDAHQPSDEYEKAVDQERSGYNEVCEANCAPGLISINKSNDFNKSTTLSPFIRNFDYSQSHIKIQVTSNSAMQNMETDCNETCTQDKVVTSFKDKDVDYGLQIVRNSSDHTETMLIAFIITPHINFTLVQSPNNMQETFLDQQEVLQKEKANQLHNNVRISVDAIYGHNRELAQTLQIYAKCAYTNTHLNDSGFSEHGYSKPSQSSSEKIKSTQAHEVLQTRQQYSINQEQNRYGFHNKWIKITNRQLQGYADDEPINDETLQLFLNATRKPKRIAVSEFGSLTAGSVQTSDELYPKLVHTVLIAPQCQNVLQKKLFHSDGHVNISCLQVSSTSSYTSFSNSSYDSLSSWSTLSSVWYSHFSTSSRSSIRTMSMPLTKRSQSLNMKSPRSTSFKQEMMVQQFDFTTEKSSRINFMLTVEEQYDSGYGDDLDYGLAPTKPTNKEIVAVVNTIAHGLADQADGNSDRAGSKKHESNKNTESNGDNSNGNNSDSNRGDEKKQYNDSGASSNRGNDEGDKTDDGAEIRDKENGDRRDQDDHDEQNERGFVHHILNSRETHQIISLPKTCSDSGCRRGCNGECKHCVLKKKRSSNAWQNIRVKRKVQYDQPHDIFLTNPVCARYNIPGAGMLYGERSVIERVNIEWNNICRLGNVHSQLYHSNGLEELRSTGSQLNDVEVLNIQRSNLCSAAKLHSPWSNLNFSDELNSQLSHLSSYRESQRDYAYTVDTGPHIKRKYKTRKGNPNVNKQISGRKGTSGSSTYLHVRKKRCHCTLKQIHQRQRLRKQKLKHRHCQRGKKIKHEYDRRSSKFYQNCPRKKKIEHKNDPLCNRRIGHGSHGNKSYKHDPLGIRCLRDGSNEHIYDQAVRSLTHGSLEEWIEQNQDFLFRRSQGSFENRKDHRHNPVIRRSHSSLEEKKEPRRDPVIRRSLSQRSLEEKKEHRLDPVIHRSDSQSSLKETIEHIQDPVVRRSHINGLLVEGIEHKQNPALVRRHRNNLLVERFECKQDQLVLRYQSNGSLGKLAAHIYDPRILRIYSYGSLKENIEHRNDPLGSNLHGHVPRGEKCDIRYGRLENKINDRKYGIMTSLLTPNDPTIENLQSVLDVLQTIDSTHVNNNLQTDNTSDEDVRQKHPQRYENKGFMNQEQDFVDASETKEQYGGRGDNRRHRSGLRGNRTHNLTSEPMRHMNTNHYPTNKHCITVQDSQSALDMPHTNSALHPGHSLGPDVRPKNLTQNTIMDFRNPNPGKIDSSDKMEKMYDARKYKRKHGHGPGINEDDDANNKTNTMIYLHNGSRENFIRSAYFHSATHTSSTSTSLPQQHSLGPDVRPKNLSQNTVMDLRNPNPGKIDSSDEMENMYDAWKYKRKHWHGPGMDRDYNPDDQPNTMFNPSNGLRENVLRSAYVQPTSDASSANTTLAQDQSLGSDVRPKYSKRNEKTFLWLSPERGVASLQSEHRHGSRNDKRRLRQGPRGHCIPDAVMEPFSGVSTTNYHERENMAGFRDYQPVTETTHGLNTVNQDHSLGPNVRPMFRNQNKRGNDEYQDNNDYTGENIACAFHRQLSVDLTQTSTNPTRAYQYGIDLGSNPTQGEKDEYNPADEVTVILQHLQDDAHNNSGYIQALVNQRDHLRIARTSTEFLRVNENNHKGEAFVSFGNSQPRDASLDNNTNIEEEPTAINTSSIRGTSLVCQPSDANSRTSMFILTTSKKLFHFPISPVNHQNEPAKPDDGFEEGMIALSYDRVDIMPLSYNRPGYHHTRQHGTAVDNRMPQAQAAAIEYMTDNESVEGQDTVEDT